MFIVGILFLVVASVVVQAKEHQHHKPTEHANDQNSLMIEYDGVKYNLSWCADFDDQSIIFKVEFPKENLPEANRWLMIGFSDHGLERGSDFCMYSEDGLWDGFVEDNDDMSLKKDIQQDCQLIEDKYYSKGVLVFKRKFSTCDLRDYAFEPGTVQFLLASGLGKPNSLKGDNAPFHYRYNMVLQYPVKFPAEDPENDKTFAITAKDAKIPEVQTTYWCAIVKLTDEFQDKKQHIVKIEPIITPGNEQLVHHMVFYHCVGKGDKQELYNGNCHTGTQMTHMCSKVLGAWSMGASTVFYPKEAGLPIGGPDFNPYVMVEIHYNNPEGVKGKIDNSGFKFTYTPNLRPHDAGIIELGLIYSDVNSIPPGEKAFPLTGYCISDCTDKFPKDGITIFGTQLHAHATGRKLFTSHFRDGVKIGEINRDNHYSQHWQHIMALQSPVKVLPGDMLATTCVYNTEGYDHFVFGGYEISNEMCVNYIYYYPASEVEVCKSAVDNSTLAEWFKKHRVSDQYVHKKFEKLEGRWDNNMSKDLLELYSSGDIHMHCLNNSGDKFPGREDNWEKIPHPRTFSGIYHKTRADYECPSINDY